MTQTPARKTPDQMADATPEEIRAWRLTDPTEMTGAELPAKVQLMVVNYNGTAVFVPGEQSVIVVYGTEFTAADIDSQFDPDWVTVVTSEGFGLVWNEDVEVVS